MTERQFITEFGEAQLALKLELEKEGELFFQDYFTLVLEHIERQVLLGSTNISIPATIRDKMREYASVVLTRTYRGENLSNYDSSMLLSILVSKTNARINQTGVEIDAFTNKQIEGAIRRALDALDTPYTTTQLLERTLPHLRDIWGRRAKNIAVSETQAYIEMSVFETNEYAETQSRWYLLLDDFDNAERLLRSSTVFSYLMLADELRETPQERRMVVLGTREKMWQSMEDAKVRPTHAAVNQTRIPKDDFFIVGGFPMRYPGDSLAPPQEVANCRCVCIYL